MMDRKQVPLGMAAMMTRDDIEKRLAPLFVSVLEIQSFSPAIAMNTTPEWDSLKHLELLAALERTFGIQIQFEHAIRLVSVEAIIEALLDHYLKEGHG